MSLIRVTPFAGINGLHRLMDHFWRDSRFLAPADSEEIQPVRRPISDVYETRRQPGLHHGAARIRQERDRGHGQQRLSGSQGRAQGPGEGGSELPPSPEMARAFPTVLPASPQSGSGEGLGRTEERSPQHRDPQVGSGETQADRGPSQLKSQARGPRNLPPPGPFPLRRKTLGSKLGGATSLSPSSSPTRNHRLQSLRSDAPLVSGRIGRARSRSETSWKLRIPNSKSPTSRNFSGFRVAAAPSMLPRRPTAGCSRGSASFFGATLGRAFLAGFTGSGRIQHLFESRGSSVGRAGD